MVTGSMPINAFEDEPNEIYELSNPQRDFISKVFDVIDTDWFRRKYKNKIAFKRKGDKTIWIFEYNQIKGTLNHVLQHGAYYHMDKPMFNKLRQIYKKYRRYETSHATSESSKFTVV